MWWWSEVSHLLPRYNQCEDSMSLIWRVNGLTLQVGSNRLWQSKVVPDLSCCPKPFWNKILAVQVGTSGHTQHRQDPAWTASLVPHAVVSTTLESVWFPRHVFIVGVTLLSSINVKWWSQAAKINDTSVRNIGCMFSAYRWKLLSWCRSIYRNILLS